MDKLEVELFSRAAINIIIQDITELDIIIPCLIFDYSTEPDISSGYYMHQNISGNIITTEKDAVKLARFDRSDIYALKLKTVIDVEALLSK